MSLEELLAEATKALENTYLDPASRHWISMFVTALEDEGWKAQPQQKSDSGHARTAAKLAAVGISHSK